MSEAEISVLKEQYKMTNKRLEKIEETVPTIDRLSTLLELTIETNKEQSVTLAKINENLTNLNFGMTDLSNRVTEIEDGNKNEEINQLQQSVKGIDERVKNIEKSKIDWNEFFKGTFVKILGTVVTLGVLAWLASQFGMTFLK